MVAVQKYHRTLPSSLTAVKCAIFLVFLAFYGAEARFGSVPVFRNEKIILDSNPPAGSSNVASLSTSGSTNVVIENVARTCKFILSAGTGNLTTEKKGSNGTFKEAWSAGKSDLGISSASFTVQMRQDGILEKFLSPSSSGDDVVFYETVRQVDMDYDYEAGDFLNSRFRLLMDDDCVLRIYGRVKNTAGADVDREVWSNMRKAMTEEDVMLQGDILRGKRKGLDSFMVLQHDCNLVQKYGNDKADAGSQVWASGTEESADDVECWVLVDNAKVRVCVGEFNPNNRHNCNDSGVKIEYSTSFGDWDVVILGNSGFQDATP